MSIEGDIKDELINCGADFVKCVDISKLPDEQNKLYSNAILIGIALSPGYIQEVTNTPDYAKKMICNNRINDDEFHLREIKTDRLADYIAHYLRMKGYSAYSQSEDNIYLTGFYDEKRKSTPLPHKIIAGLAGLGWIGKHNLLVTPEYGSAICICTVLTDAPLTTVLYDPVNSLCGDCSICIDVCQSGAIAGNFWTISTSRDELVDVFKCVSCLECLVVCPWTQTYCEKNIAQ